MWVLSQLTYHILYFLVLSYRADVNLVDDNLGFTVGHIHMDHIFILSTPARCCYFLGGSLGCKLVSVQVEMFT